MRLVDLQPQFLQHRKGIAPDYHGQTLPDGTVQWGGFEIDEFHNVDSLTEAHGIKFLCPKDFAKNGGPEGTHCVMVMFMGSPVPENLFLDSSGKSVRWNVVSGTGYADLTLTPSILEVDNGRCGWHGFITSGEAITV